MTDKEKAVVMAFTGIAMLEGEKFSVFHKYIEDICGRQIYSHEMGDKKLWEEIEEKSKDDFFAMCKSADPIDRVLEIIEKRRKDINDSDLDAGTIAVVLSEWLVFEKEVLKMKGGEQE